MMENWKVGRLIQKSNGKRKIKCRDTEFPRQRRAGTEDTQSTTEKSSSKDKVQSLKAKGPSEIVKCMFHGSDPVE